MLTLHQFDQLRRQGGGITVDFKYFSAVGMSADLSDFAGLYRERLGQCLGNGLICFALVGRCRYGNP